MACAARSTSELAHDMYRDRFYALVLDLELLGWLGDGLVDDDLGCLEAHRRRLFFVTDAFAPRLDGFRDEFAGGGNRADDVA